jgi:prepilin peptidase CpaA
MSSGQFFNFDLFQSIVKALYVASLCYGFVSDVKSLRIPNVVSLSVAALFFAHYFSAPASGAIAPHLIAAGGAFLFMFAVYAAGFMGAGDVKLIGALMLWAGVRDGPAFLLLMSLTGGLIAFVLLLARKVTLARPSTTRYIPSRRLRVWTRLGIFPYGTAICTAGLILMPAFFQPR